jgi:enterochelin esterase-like enzyme
MVFRLIVLVGLLVLEVTGVRALMAAVPAESCKSTVTGTLEMVSFESKIYGDKRLLRVWLPPGYSDSQASAQRYPVLYMLMGNSFSIAARLSRFRVSGMWTKP